MPGFDKEKNISSSAYVLLLLSFAVINLVGLAPLLSSATNLLFTPVIFVGQEVGYALQSSYQNLTSLNTILKEKNELLIENALLKAENSQIYILKDRLEIVERELTLNESNDLPSVKAEVLSIPSRDILDMIHINKGSVDGIKVGNSARFGNIYIGTVESVDRNSSRIVLPSFTKSFLQVAIIPRIEDVTHISLEELNALVNSTTREVWEGVAVGVTNGIEIQNIPKNADIKIGDHVFVNDSEVGRILYLGDIGKITVDPTEVQIRANITLPLIPRNLINLLIDIEVE